LLWITFAVKRFLGLFGSVILLAGTLLNKEASNALITYRIYGLIYTVSLAVLFLALTIIWTRNLKRLKSLCP
jgi:ABC-type sulfate transport system permease component